MKCDIWRWTLPLGQSAGAASRLMNRQQLIHSYREKDTEGAGGRAGEKDWDGVKEKGKKKETEKESLNVIEDSSWWEVRYSVKGGHWAACCVLSLETCCERLRRQLHWLEVRVLAPHLSFFHFIIPLIHSASPLLFRTNLYKRPRLLYAHICVSMYTCVVNGAHGWWGISSREARRCQMKQIGTFDSCQSVINTYCLWRLLLLGFSFENQTY